MPPEKLRSDISESGQGARPEFKRRTDGERVSAVDGMTQSRAAAAVDRKGVVFPSFPYRLRG